MLQILYLLICFAKINSPNCLQFHILYLNYITLNYADFTNQNHKIYLSYYIQTKQYE